jgi:hypothetical protein
MFQNFNYVLAIVLFVLGLAVCMTYTSRDVEGFNTQLCPDTLVQKGASILLYNSKTSEKPVVFNNLEEYVDFVNVQQQRKVACPVLFLQQMNNAQGETVYNVRPSPTNPNAGDNVDPTLLQDASRNDPPFNKNSYPGFDPQNQMVGEYNMLDQYYNVGTTQSVSANAMDPNWGGAEYSQAAVDAGNYVGDQIMVVK